MEYMCRRIMGRFREIDEKTLQKMCLEMKCLLKSWGAMGPVINYCGDDKLPLWAEVEFLDNIVQFELENNPFLHNELFN